MSSFDPGANITRSLYAIVLSKDDKAPNLPKNDIEESKKNDDKKSDDANVVNIDEDDIFNRAVALDLSARNYTALAKGPKLKVFVAESIQNENGLKVHSYDVAKQKATDFAKGISQMVTSNDRKSILLRKGSSWVLTSTASAPRPGKDLLKTNLKIKLDPKAEAHQIFKEGWRYMRDFLYVDNVHGAPWDDVYKWYSPWIDHVRHRTDLNYVVDIMSGEVAIGHSYVSGGDLPNLGNVPIGLLGADYIISNGHYQISKLYNGERWNPNIEAPLTQPGNSVKVGDYILEINGKKLSDSDNIHYHLEQTASREVTLTVNSKPSLQDARKVLVKPTRSERGLRTIDWVN